MSWLDAGLLEGKGKKERSGTAHHLAPRSGLQPPREPGRLERKEARVEASEGARGELYGGPGLYCSWAAESLFEKEHAGPTPGTGVARLTPAPEHSGRSCFSGSVFLSGFGTSRSKLYFQMDRRN